MEKVYLLLRNGHQSGPFTIGDLLQQQLKASDMIWIEGKSSAWSYLSEMEFTPVDSDKLSDPVSSKVVPFTSSGDEIERKAEELRKRALAYVPKTKHPDTPFVQKVYTRNTPEEVQPVHFVDHRKERKSIVNELVMTALIIGTFGAVLYGSRSYFKQDEQLNTVANKIESSDNHTAIGSASVEKETSKPIHVIAPPLTDSIVLDSVSVPVVEKIKPSYTIKPLKKPVKIKQVQTEPLAIKADDIAAQLAVPPAEDLVKKEIVVPVEKETVAPAEKKKTVGQALRGLFKKKKKDEDKPSNPDSQTNVKENR